MARGGRGGELRAAQTATKRRPYKRRATEDGSTRPDKKAAKASKASANIVREAAASEPPAREAADAHTAAGTTAATHNGDGGSAPLTYYHLDGAGPAVCHSLSADAALGPHFEYVPNDPSLGLGAGAGCSPDDENHHLPASASAWHSEQYPVITVSTVPDPSDGHHHHHHHHHHHQQAAGQQQASGPPLTAAGLTPIPLPNKRLSTNSVRSASSATSSSLSNCATLSPLNTDVPSVTDGLSVTSASAWSRGPSPLRLTASPVELRPPPGPGAEGDISALSLLASTHHYHLPASADEKTTTTRKNELLADTNTTAAVPHHAFVHACNWATCTMPSFSTREGLAWHVKAEHLLVCPVAGCCEGNFQSRKILSSHIRVAHPKAVGGKSLASSLTAEEPRRGQSQTGQASLPSTAVSTRNGGGAIASKSKEVVNDQTLKMTLSIATSKRKCQEQLRSVLERRLRKSAAVANTPRSAGTPRSIDSPQDLVRSRTPKLIESASFPLVWEHGVLPFLAEFIPKWCGPGHVISVTRPAAGAGAGAAKNPNARRICIMTRRRLSRARKLAIAAHVRDLLPTVYRQGASFVFSTGEVGRLGGCWARGVSQESPDDICNPRNPFFYRTPCMGDSIGTVDDARGETTATLGPCLMVGGGSYWLANFHPFVEVYQHRDEVIAVEHPSPGDRERCLEKGHEALAQEAEAAGGFKLGDLTATSGIDLKTTRVSHDPYWEEADKDPPLVVTDWTLVSSRTRAQANMLRRFPTTATAAPPRPAKETPVTSTSAVVPGAAVVSTGRTSGHQRGQVCEVPAYVSGDRFGNGTGRATREWFVEEPCPSDGEDAWIRGGIGVKGDSGAAIVDAETNALVGQLWGRNRYFGAGPRHAFFTPLNDLFDDIQERCGEQARPQLPQYRDESERWVVYPLCRPCFDLAAYLDSRRSSRESLRSMLGGSSGGGVGGAGRFFGGFGGGDDRDRELSTLTEGVSVSELATPQDHSYWVRHAGPDEASGGGVISPVPMPMGSSFTFQNNTFGTPPAGCSPRVAEMSPYALNLDAEDLYDAEYEVAAVAVAPNPPAKGKRTALPSGRGSYSYQQADGSKRRRVA